MTAADRDYFTSLCDRARVGAVEWVAVETVCDEGWTPISADCHANAKRWQSLTPGRKRVCGWLIDGTDTMGGYMFKAHSVVEDGGVLRDITPADAFPDTIREPESPRLFLRHEGSDETFYAMLPQYNSIMFNPLMYA